MHVQVRVLTAFEPAHYVELKPGDALSNPHPHPHLSPLTLTLTLTLL